MQDKDVTTVQSTTLLPSKSAPTCISCTVAIPVFNRKEMVMDAIASALGQECDNLEVLVIDNASTDGTWEAIQSLSAPNLRVVRNESNLGVFGNLNRCLELASGTYLRLLCSDDTLTPGTIAAEMALMDQHPSAALLTTQYDRIDENGTFLSRAGNLLKPGLYDGRVMGALLLWTMSHYCRNPFNFPSGILLRREAALEAGRFEDSFSMVGDIDFWEKILLLGDALVADFVGCRVMSHSGQIGYRLFEDGRDIGDWLVLARRYRSVLDAEGIYKQVLEQTVACTIWRWYYFMRRGRFRVAAACLNIGLRSGVSVWSIIPATLRFILRQIRYKRTGALELPASFKPRSGK